MPLNRDRATYLARDLFQQWFTERDRLGRIDKWYRSTGDRIEVPRTATKELKALAELSKTPWLGLVVTTVAQCMYVDGYRSPDAVEPLAPWRTWMRNGFDARQVAIHRAALAYGYAYATALPGEVDGESMAVLRGVSPRNMFAVYQDPAEDDWPMYAVRVFSDGKDRWSVRLYDEEAVYYLSCGADGGQMEFISYDLHGAGVCPVVRYTNMLDLDGRMDGEVAPFIPLAGRINKTSFDRLITQHFTSWTVRTIAGMTAPDTDEESNRKKLQLRQDDILIAEDKDTKFGTLPGTPLDGFIKAHEADIKTLAAVSQTPAHTLTGDLINLSAEALAAARAELTAKVAERSKSFGKSHAQLLRLAAALEGDAVSAADVMASVSWQDTSIRSLASAADAYGKFAQMLGVPTEALWSKIPGVDQTEVQEWREEARRSGSRVALTALANAANAVRDGDPS